MNLRLLIIGYVGLLIVLHGFRAVHFLPPITESWWSALLILKPTMPLWLLGPVSPDK